MPIFNFKHHTDLKIEGYLFETENCLNKAFTRHCLFFFTFKFFVYVPCVLKRTGILIIFLWFSFKKKKENKFEFNSRCKSNVSGTGS